MGYRIENREALFQALSREYDLYAPVRKIGEGCFSETDVIRYDKIRSLDDIVWDKKSDYSFKEVLTPINETMFYFTEHAMTEPEPPRKKSILFLRSCDLHAVRRQDAVYLQNGAEDFYYKRRREGVKFALMGCPEPCGTGFCVSMGTNQCTDYDFSIKIDGDVYVDCKDESLQALFAACSAEERPVSPDFVRKNNQTVQLPKHLTQEAFQDPIWEEYGARCIGCGRCNFVCPTCTCFTTQDIFYRDNENVGERRRVWASCQVDGYTDIAGGISFRKKQADRVRFKVLHKIADFEKRFGYPMCVGCGRCDAVCPEYISYACLVNRLAAKEEA